MRVCAIIKYPPIQGGVSARSYWMARALAERGHDVHVVTNAGEVEPAYRMWLSEEDAPRLEVTFPGSGSVRVTSTGRDGWALKHIPQSNPFVSKLASVATEVIRRERCDVIFSYYFEPYGVAAHLASIWTNLPHVVQHAGSDRGRLMNHPELVFTYREMLRAATTVVTRDDSVEGLGVPVERVRPASVAFLPRGLFTPEVAPLDVASLLERAADHPHARNPGAWRPEVPTVGIVGKVGETKGTYDLVAALAAVRARGHDFNLLALAAGSDRPRFIDAVVAAGLGDRTWTLPILPHWRVGAFLRACTAVCFLERRFPIAEHHPGIPVEVLATGTCAILSREVVDKQPFRQRIRSGENAVVVEEPGDVAELSAALEMVIASPERARHIGAAGAAIVSPGDEGRLGATYENILEDSVRRHVDGRAPRRGSRARDDGEANASHGAVRDFLERRMPATAILFADELTAQLEAWRHEEETWQHEDAADRGEGAVRGEKDPVPVRAYRLVDALIETLERRGARPIDSRLLLLRFERDLLWASIDLEGPLGASPFPASPGSPLRPRTPPRHGELRPVRSNWLRVTDHPKGIEQVLQRVRRGEVHAAAELEGAGTATYVFQKRGDLSSRVFVINDATREIVDLCDGSRTLSSIAAILDSRGVPAKGHLTEVLRRLVQERVVTLS